MANQEHLDILKQGVANWNRWREEQTAVEVDLSEVNLDDANLSQANLRKVNLSKAELRNVDLYKADLRECNLSKADLRLADLRAANLSGADLSQAKLSQAKFVGANLSRANLRGAQPRGVDFTEADLTEANLADADLTRAAFVETNLEHAILNNCSIYGISVWNVHLEGAQQSSLIITSPDEPIITVDNLKIAQFIYLLLNNREIREVIDTVAKKAVLILGRFTPERKAVLDTLREELRTRGFLPILFDFDKPASRDITETISTLAHLVRFVIADITDAKSIPQELILIVPNLPSVPVQPLILESQHEYAMFEHFTRFPWVLPLYHYTDQASLLQSLKENVLDPAEQKAQELSKR